MNKQEIKLQAPGAGLPFFQRLFLKYYMGPFVSKKGSWENLAKRFTHIYSSVLKECEGLSQGELNTRVLVDPLPGIEDSSRYWSLAMTLEHMLIVGEGIKSLIVELSHNRPISQKVDIADFKPKPDSPKDPLIAMQSFQKNTLVDLESRMGNRDSKATHFHPWFGPFTAHQWFWLLSGHGYIHLVQIRKIKEGLRKS